MRFKLSSRGMLLLIIGLALVPAGAQPEPSQTNPSVNQTTEISRERREQAFAKLLEAQRYFWRLNRIRSQAAVGGIVKLVKQTLAKAIELDPTLSEAHTLLAELNVYYLPNDISEALRLAKIAVKLNPDNFGAHQILAQIYTSQSGLDAEKLYFAAVQMAVAEWKEVARLDPRNAEAWAFLSEFYGRQNQAETQIFALNKWLEASPPPEENDPRRLFPPNFAKQRGRHLTKGAGQLAAGGHGQSDKFCFGRTISGIPEPVGPDGRSHQNHSLHRKQFW
jgi:tetratricopeptide (TPR) repeat protein